MINGDVKEFVNHIYYGDELTFLYKGQKFFLQGLTINGKQTLLLDRWDPPSGDYIWKAEGDTAGNAYPADAFLKATIWDGRDFYHAEMEMEWVD